MAEMEPYEILARGIPRGKAKMIASTLGVSESLVTKWTREPASDENPDARSTLNPIERVDRLFDFLLIYSPEMASVLASRYATKLHEFHTRQLRDPLSDADWHRQLGLCLRESGEAIAALVENAPASVVRQEWEQAK